jgi:hypothetical protein
VVHIRFLVPEMAPRSLRGNDIEASLAPAFAGVLLCSVPLHVVIVLWACGCIDPNAPLLHNVSSDWWLTLFGLSMWPGVL